MKLSSRKLSKEHKAKISLSLQGHVVSEETKRKMSKALKGKPSWAKGTTMNEETKKKIGLTNKGKTCYFKGKKRSESTRQKMRLSQLGKKTSLETRKKLSIANSGVNHYNYGKKLKPSTIQKIKNARAKQVLPQKDTKPERFLQEVLHNEKIKFRTHEPIMGQPDIFIDPDICIFVDGDYWHNLPKAIKHDIIVNDSLEKDGYHILRFWEHEIYNNMKTCVHQILEQVNEGLVK